jgi:hypothetical protein
VTIRGFVAVESICVEFKETLFQIEYLEIWHERQRRHSALGSEPGDPRAYCRRQLKTEQGVASES